MVITCRGVVNIYKGVVIVGMINMCEGRGLCVAYMVSNMTIASKCYARIEHCSNRVFPDIKASASYYTYITLPNADWGLAPMSVATTTNTCLSLVSKSSGPNNVISPVVASTLNRVLIAVGTLSSRR